ncbi:GroES-like protein [Trametes versicolor FP-101664 SS1]|uniref:GroES-like protein n=1 Tax=Trametes versicolor (strain FP-101664) TaxID=717944 RepID=UPI000462467B|nr:GroES-like protein [Trametes versicolor FP-101664 SS1]EIW57462.1 GroES-like protein [Trametes versicolor FP-101664 SS1]
MSQASPHPDSYTAYAFTEVGNGKLQKITVPWRDPTDNEIVVKVLACGVCGSDAVIPDGLYPTSFPRIPGHEIVGDIVALPASEKVWKLGQRVGGGWHGGHCHTCTRCRVGDFITCQHEDINGVFRDGGYAEYAILRSEAVITIPDGLDPVQAAPLLCAGITVYNSLRHMNAIPPDYVAVQGIGGLGHLALQIANAMGFRAVALSSGSSKETLARSLGAQEYIDGSKVDQAAALQALGGAKVIMCTAPNSEVMGKLLPGLAIDGTLLFIALAIEPITLAPVQLIGGRFSIRGWPSGHAADTEDCLAFAKAHNIKCMVEVFPLEKAQEAYDHRGSARFRAVVVPGL